MTRLLFREDAYRQRAPGRVMAHTPEGGVVLDQSLFYATGGGQPGDSGRLDWDGGALDIATTIKGEGGQIVMVPTAPEAALPPVGAEVEQVLDWDRRFGHMRIHTALHLLSVAVALPVSGGSIGAQKGRLDFDMPEASVDKEALTGALNALIARDLPIGEDWISDAQLAANPALVKTMSVRPPAGQGRVRLIWIGEGEARIDLQPCGGTHVARTGEIGRVRIGKVQKKGRQNRRIYLELDG
jgi:misacylated tRNA(Ala) deacylase